MGSLRSSSLVVPRPCSYLGKRPGMQTSKSRGGTWANRQGKLCAMSRRLLNPQVASSATLWPCGSTSSTTRCRILRPSARVERGVHDESIDEHMDRGFVLSGARLSNRDRGHGGVGVILLTWRPNTVTEKLSLGQGEFLRARVIARSCGVAADGGSTDNGPSRLKRRLLEQIQIL